MAESIGAPSTCTLASVTQIRHKARRHKSQETSLRISFPMFPKKVTVASRLRWMGSPPPVCSHKSFSWMWDFASTPLQSPSLFLECQHVENDPSWTKKCSKCHIVPFSHIRRGGGAEVTPATGTLSAPCFMHPHPWKGILIVGGSMAVWGGFAMKSCGQVSVP